MCVLHPLSRPSSCEVSAHGAVTSSSLVPGAEGLIQTPPIYGGALWAWGMTAFGLTQSWGTTPGKSISGQGMSDLSIQCMGDSALLKWHYGQLNKNLLRTHCMLGTVPGAGELAIKKPQEIWEVVVETGINT